MYVHTFESFVINAATGTFLENRRSQTIIDQVLIHVRTDHSTDSNGCSDHHCRRRDTVFLQERFMILLEDVVEKGSLVVAV
jgi:hypothetical protein